MPFGALPGPASHLSPSRRTKRRAAQPSTLPSPSCLLEISFYNLVKLAFLDGDAPEGVRRLAGAGP